MINFINTIATSCKRMSAIIKNKNKRAAFATLCSIRRQYGWKNAIKCIRNKMHGYPLLQEIITDNNSISSEKMDNIGRELLDKQQKELTILEQEDEISRFKTKPTISVIMPVYNPPIKWLEIAIRSIQRQSYANWELCITDDGSKDKRGIELIKKIQSGDKRIKLCIMPTNGGISSASNVSLKMAKGEYIALVDQDDEITHDAFFWFVKEINLHPDADFLYSDECKIGESLTINPTCFYLKPNWSPELLINHMYTGHLTMYRTELVRSIGGFRSEYDFSQDYDLALRMSDVTEHIYHIERVLYFWRMIPSSAAAGGKDYARISNIAAVHDWYKRHNLHSLQEYRPYANYGSLVMEENPLVSIIIPTDSIKMLKNCIQGLVSDTSYKNIEVIPVTNSKTAEEIIEEYSYLTILKVCCYDKLYNFSDKCNMGVNMASGKYVVIYNDDVYPSTRDWIERMLEILKYPKVGGVSPLLIHEDGTIQYAGMITGTPGLVGTSFNNMPLLLKEPNPYCHFLLRNVSVLSGACMMMDREVFQRIKGFDPVNTPTGHSDVDISFRIQEQGLRCVFTPYAVLIHKGNHSWETTDRMDKADVYCLKRWGKYIAADYYFTKSMRKMYYHDFCGEYEIYMPEKTISNKPYRKDILFITHELSLTGAPIVLCEAVKVSLKNGDYPVVMCPQDGPLRKKYLDMGVVVIIDGVALNNGDMFRRFAHNFDLIVVNTIACYWAIQYLSNYLPPVLWWIHEGKAAAQIFIDHLPKKIGNNIFPYYVCNYTKKVMEKHRLYKSSGLLIYGIEDAAMGVMTKYNQNNKVKFLTVGSIEHRKGQDILLEAIKRLPKEYQDKAEFLFIGKILDDNIKQIINNLSEKLSCIKYRDAVPHEEIYKYYLESLCLIIPSRDDPFPVTGIESMMFYRTIITSDNTGFAELIVDGKNGFIFQNENYEELMKKIKYVIDHINETLEMGNASRLIYEHNCKIDIFHDNYVNIVNKLIINHST